MFYDYSVLVIAEPDFLSKITDGYKDKLVKFLKDRAGDATLRIVTVDGKFNFPGFEAKPSDDRNKTGFVKAVEDYLTQLNEIVIIANYEAHPFFEALNTRASEAGTTVSVYGY